MTAGRWSLRTRLVALLAALTVLVWCAGSVWLYRSAGQQAGELFDAALVETAHAVFAAVAHEGLRKDEDFDFEPAGHAHAERLYYQLRDRRGTIRYASPGAPRDALAAPDESGFTKGAADGIAYRVYTLREPRGRAAIHVGQRLADRAELARSLALRLLAPGLAVVLLLSLGAWIVVRRVTAPVVAFSRAIDARAPAEGGAVALDGLPDEVRPVGIAVNRLLARVEDALLRERTLTADAAHELRTPLAALRAQAQVAFRARDDAERSAALQALLGGVDRATRLVETVLTLARLDAQTTDRVDLPGVALRPLVDSAVEQLGATARAAGRTVEVDVPAMVVPADRDSLAIALRNLIENAIRHAASSIHVGARIEGPHAVIGVLDDGRGMPTEEQARAFDRFYRGRQPEAPGGAGLGLALVKRVAELHGGGVRFAPGLGARGLGVEIVLPLGRPPSGER